MGLGNLAALTEEITYRVQGENIGQNHFGQQTTVRHQFCERPYSQEFRKFVL